MNVQWFARLAQRLSGEVGRRQTFTLVGGTLAAALLNRESVAAGCKKAGRASRTGQPSAASSSSCARDAPGACSPRNSVAAAGRPAGDGCGTGRKLACGHGCTRPCSTGWAMPPLLIGTGRVSIHSASGPKRGASRPGRTRSTVASSAPNTIWSSTAMASPWPCASRRPTLTTRPSSCPILTLSLRSSDHEENQVGPVSVLLRCTPIRPTTPRPCAARSGRGASHPGSRVAGSTPPSDSDDTAGWWSGRSRGSSAIAASVCATNDGSICFKDCCTWPVP